LRPSTTASSGMPSGSSRIRSCNRGTIGGSFCQAIRARPSAVARAGRQSSSDRPRSPPASRRLLRPYQTVVGPAECYRVRVRSARVRAVRTRRSNGAAMGDRRRGAFVQLATGTSPTAASPCGAQITTCTAAEARAGSRDTGEPAPQRGCATTPAIHSRPARTGRLRATSPVS
jgi:hypothetical protein